MGNTHGKRSGYSEEAAEDAYRPASPPASPGSPLTYSPQVPMEPFSRQPEKDEFPSSSSAKSTAAEFHGLSGWPAQPKLVPTVILWTHGGNEVEVEGSFDNWTQRHKMQQSGKDFTIVKLLPPGVYQYKFIVDGEWKYAPDQPALYDEMHNVNNVLEVQEYIPENLDSLSGFEPPPSPPSSYHDPLPAPEDYAREPPSMPPHLQLTLLNVPPALDATASLPRPQHVILNHLYCRRTSESVNALVVGTTHRFKSKYVTTVMYKPKPRRRSAQGPAEGAPGGGFFLQQQLAPGQPPQPLSHN